MQTIGERLEEARKKKGISIREAAEATKIRGDYLQKFESNHFDIGLTEIYARGFLRTYSNYLKLPAERILADYAALGRGDIRPRQPSREVYGRMDISVSTAGESSERAEPPKDGAPEPAPTRPQPRQPRGGNNLPSGPAIDPKLLVQGAKILGVLVVIALIVWAGVSLRGSRSPSSGTTATTTTQTPAQSTASTPATSPAAEERTTVITALETVVIQVWECQPDASYGPVLLAPTTLLRGETRTVQRNGPLYVGANPMVNIQIDRDGKRMLPGVRFPNYPVVKVE